MKYTLGFNEFLFDKILEKSTNMIYFRLSDRLYNLLNSINHKISEDIISLHDDFDTLKEISLIDYHDENHNLFTFATSNKIYDEYAEKMNSKDSNNINWHISNQLHNPSNDIWKKYRSDIRIGRFINRIFPGKYPESGKPGEDIQSFIDNIKSKRSGGDELFKIVKGDELLKYYNEESYSLEKGKFNQLHQSCMKYDKCGEYMDFYIKNNIQMVVLMSDIEKDKIVGRAILWKLSEPDRYFMDRIYFINDYDMEKFKSYAIKNNWLYKEKQNRSPYENICDPQTNKCEDKLLIIENIKPTNKYPYLDTLSFFYKDQGILSNTEDLLMDNETNEPYYLQSTDGGYSVNGMVYSNYYNRLVDPDDLIWCALGEEERLNDDCVYVETDDVYATVEYANEHLKKSKLMNKWINPKSDYSVYLKRYDDWVTSWFLDSYTEYYELEEDYLLKHDAIWSDYHDTHIPKDEAFDIVSMKRGNIYTDYAHKKYKHKFKKIINKHGEEKYFNLPEEEIKKLNI